LTTATAAFATAFATATATEGQWGTIRTALICYAGDQREAGNDAWADQIMKAYEILRNQTR
jgi:hypothetical protein